MIVQCGQCNTKFRLDDAKIKETGVKVRCSKCRHIFMVYRENRQEGSDFDSLLGGLSSAAAAEEVQPSLSSPAVESPESMAGVQSAQQDDRQIESSVSGGEFDFSAPVSEDKEAAFPVEKSSAQEEPVWGEGLGEGFDFSEPQEDVRQPASERVSTADGDFSVQDSQDSGRSSAEFQFSDSGPELNEGPGGGGTADFVDNPAEDGFFLELSGEEATGHSKAQDLPFPVSETDQFGGLESAETFAAAGASQGVAESAQGAASSGTDASKDLPPLPITSRRASPGIPVVGVVVSVLAVIMLAGFGFYFFSEGTDSLFAKLTGGETVEEGKITLRNTTATYVVNKGAGELVVIAGDAVNDFRKPRASIQVRAFLYGPKGVVLMRKVAYCGNKLTKEQLASLPLSKIEAAMNNQFGDSLCNLGVAPGKSIPFVAVFSKAPKEAVEYGVEVAGSTVASQ